MHTIHKIIVYFVIAEDVAGLSNYLGSMCFWSLPYFVYAALLMLLAHISLAMSWYWVQILQVSASVAHKLHVVHRRPFRLFLVFFSELKSKKKIKLKSKKKLKTSKASEKARSELPVVER